MLQPDPISRKMLRQTYILICGVKALLNAALPRNRGLAVFYGGARTGDVGGPLVKVKRLSEYFPEVHWRYNLVYLLSNAQYLPPLSLKLLKHRSVPIVHNQNGVFYKGWYAGDWAAQNRLMAHSYHAADWVFYQSEFCRRSADEFLGVRDGVGEILYNAVDTVRFSPAPAQSGAKGRDFVFLITGKINDHLYYRLESSIAGLKISRDAGLEAQLVVAGWVEGGARKRAEILAADLGISGKMRFTGAYTQEQAPEIYRGADAYVMTKHNDPCPNTVLEALATGLPVLYSDSGGVSELVGNEAGIGLPCKSSWDRPYTPTADAIGLGMLQIAARRGEFAAAARQRAVNRFDIVHWIGRHRAVFERLLAEHT